MPRKAYKSRALDQWLTKIQISEIADLEPRKPEFRVSSLPYCPILFLERLAAWYHEGASKSYAMRFYTEIGTAVHTSFQEFAKNVHPKTFYGNWKCRRVLGKESNSNTEVVIRCSKLIKEITCFDRLKVGTCPHGYSNCKDHFEYEEILFLWNGLSGHMDCLIKLNGKWILLDWKTTSNKLFDKRDRAVERSKPYYPNPKYLEQIESYAVLMKLIYGITIDQYAICYINRDKPTDPKRRIEGHLNYVYKMDKRSFKRRYKILKEQVGNHETVTKLLKKATPSLLDELIANKPCHNMEDFNAKMKVAFFGNEVCGFAKRGECFEPKAIRGIVKGYLSDIKRGEAE